MSDVAAGRRSGGSVGSGGSPFRGATVALLLAIGILSFIGMLVLGAYAPDLRSGSNGGAHALSNAATGYSGIVKLAGEMGLNPHIIRDTHDFDSEDLVVLTPEDGRVDISEPLTDRNVQPTLFVMPKWLTMRDDKHPGWVRFAGPGSPENAKRVLAPAYNFEFRQYRSGGKPLVNAQSWLPKEIAFHAARPMQVITRLGPIPKDRREDAEGFVQKMTPIITDGHGGIVVAQLGDRPLYVLSDPDLISNLAMKDAQQARSAIALLQFLNSNGAQSINFDVTTNGLGHSRSPLKLAFEPPFLAMTLTIAAALLLAGVHAFGRFGPEKQRERAIAFGKSALVDNSAALVRKAGREARIGRRYAAVIRERAVAIFGVPARLRDAALDAYLDKLKGEHKFTELAQAVEHADDRASLVRAARALHAWQREKIR